MKTGITIFLLITGITASLGQDRFTAFYEPYIKLSYDVGENYSHDFVFEERTIWYDNKSFMFSVKQIDLAHFSTFKLDDKNALAVGVQYRFRDNFADKNQNELRVTEEYTYSTQPNVTEYENRFRIEQRITSSLTSHRFRYNFAVTRPFKESKINAGDAYMIGDLETLLMVARNIKPEFEQRIGAGVGWVISDLLKIELVTEYRLTDFAQKLGNELYIVTAIKVTL